MKECLASREYMRDSDEFSHILDYGKAKSRHVLWIVSNCYAKKRMSYKDELNKFIQVSA